MENNNSYFISNTIWFWVRVAIFHRLPSKRLEVLPLDAQLIVDDLCGSILVRSRYSFFYESFYATIVSYRLIPESPRWLLAVGQHEQALLILRTAAKENKRPPFDMNRVLTNLSNTSSGEKSSKVSVRALFSTKELKKRSYLLCLNWLVVGMCYI